MKQPIIAATLLILVGSVAIALAIRLARPSDNTGA